MINTCTDAEEPQLDEKINKNIDPEPQMANVKDPSYISKNWEYKLKKRGDSC